jgi:transcriptional regulator with XRE-family HTH domain
MDILQINMEETMKNIGERIKTLRKKKHWTQDELAHHLEVAPSSVGSYERGSRQPTIENLIRMAKYFNVSLDYLLCQTEDERTLSNFKREDSKDLKDFLRDQSVMFTGLELSDQDKDKILHILTGLFWDDIINKK